MFVLLIYIPQKNHPNGVSNNKKTVFCVDDFNQLKKT